MCSYHGKKEKPLVTQTWVNYVLRGISLRLRATQRFVLGILAAKLKFLRRKNVDQMILLRS